MTRLIAAVFLAGSLFAAGTARAEDGGPEIVRLEPYKPTYFLMGSPDTKIELSFKARLIEGENVYFGYTQLMMWELFRTDPYFSDLNYNPELFYRYTVGASTQTWIDFGAFEHESNGKGGANERSWNRSYVRFHSERALSAGRSVRWSLKAWVPYSYNPSNRNLAEYRGLWEANATLADFRGNFFEVSDLTLRLYPGGPSQMDPTRGGQELTLRLKPRTRKFLPMFVGQVFHGFGENLLDYRVNRWGVRAGIGF